MLSGIPVCDKRLRQGSGCRERCDFARRSLRLIKKSVPDTHPSLYADASSINVRADQTVELLAIEWLNFICRWERKRAATVPNTPLGYGDTDVRRPQAGQNCLTEPDAGQVQGSARMASEDHYGIDILHQIRAAKAALKARFFAITRQLGCCCHQVWR
ncbi:metal-sensing transcriptional repressor (plasmid) [Agrobacterium salinitolerans]|uniref:metal-sensing transcriptional repressor n=1 Tax=Agrobacterium salinitolerans TaxID=1183413 RepID=UPI0010CA804C|nr:metal-sensing transcriptional repressor [Agrobacterium salinitolerans]